MSYAVLHCSSDQNYFWHEEICETIPYDNLERTLPVFLVDQMKSNPFAHLLVINGPWGFSQLRIMCLCVNLLKMHYPELTIASWNKVDLYHEYVTLWVLPRDHIMYIGMKKKLRSVDLQEKTYDTVTWETIQQKLNDMVSIDMVKNHLLLEESTLWPERSLEIWTSQKWLIMTFNNTTESLSRDKLFIAEKITNYITPEYMIAPKIG